MKKIILTLISLSTLALSPGEMAPNFSLTNELGATVSLSDYKGKQSVILEWYNDGCPFVRKHYDSKNMQDTQKFAKDNGHIWLSINSSNIGQQGYLDSPAAAKERLKSENSNANHLLIDTNGKVGKLYEAKTTPEIVVISKDGLIKYTGAIDSIPSADKNDIKSAQNYVRSAINDLKTNSKVKIAKTKSYGCSVKY